MAVVTLQSFVASIQLERRASIVVEVPESPVARIVTGVTSGAQFPSMDIGTVMTGITVPRSFVGIEDALVTTGAGDRPMSAQQRIRGVPIVLEMEGFPLLLLVAFVTPVSEASPVNIVSLMAGVTVGRRLVFEQGAAVAALALRASMISF